jgi:hypothetical protein
MVECVSMKGIKAVRNRILAVASGSKITQAMQLVAASEIKRVQDCMIGNLPDRPIHRGLFTVYQRKRFVQTSIFLFPAKLGGIA